MKTQVTSEAITFKFLLYSFVIPKNRNIIEYEINDSSRTAGLPAFLVVIPQNYETNIVGKVKVLFEKIWSFVSKFIFISTRRSSPYMLYIDRTPKFFIDTKKEIGFFLDLLNDNGYDVEEPIKTLFEIENAAVDPVFIPGTKEFRKDKLILALIPFVVFELLFSALYFTSTHMQQSVPGFIKMTVVIALFCYGFYCLLTLKKNK